MDGRASVLFVITIPTAAEEERFKREFLAKKYDLIKSELGEYTAISGAKFPLKVDSNKTIATTATLYTTPTTFGEHNNNDKNEDQIINDNADIISTTTVDAPISIGGSAKDERVTSELGTIQYGTFPKRSKLSQKTNTLEELSRIITTQEDMCSIKAIDINSTAEVMPTRKSRESNKDILSSTKRKMLKKKNQHSDLELEEDICMEAVLNEILKKFHIQGATWTKNIEGVMYQILFTVEFNETYEKILNNLNDWGIGDREGSTVSVMNCITSKTFAGQKLDNEMENDFCTENNFAQKSAWDRFMNSVRSRLNVANIIRDVRHDAAITFDFVVLLVSAAILASFGLVEDSTIFLASSMLISPLMGPIIAAIFGTVIKDHSLRRLGLKNEIFGILMAVFVGFLFGMVVCTTDDRYSIGDGLTEEMLARCELHSLIVGVFTAIPSGGAAAIGILGGNIGSLVGVAISASLLPPAVNSVIKSGSTLLHKNMLAKRFLILHNIFMAIQFDARSVSRSQITQFKTKLEIGNPVIRNRETGNSYYAYIFLAIKGLLWALAVIYKFFEKDESRYNSVVKTTLYSKNQATELAILGSISMCLTISNIICIYIMGILVLKVKEIAPVISGSNRSFWKHDIKIARDLNRNGFDADTAVIDEFANLPKEDQRALGISCDFLRNIQKDEALYQNTWSPVGGRHSFENNYQQIRKNYSTVHRLDRLYSTITQQHFIKEKRNNFMLRRNTGHLAEHGTSYKILSENIPRCSTMPTKILRPTINLITSDTTVTANSIPGVSRSTTNASTPTGTIDDRKKRKFIVTPAEEDPLYSAYTQSEDADI